MMALERESVTYVSHLDSDQVLIRFTHVFSSSPVARRKSVDNARCSSSLFEYTKMPTKPVPVQTNPVTIDLPDGTQLCTTYNEAKEVHKIICDVCLTAIQLTKTGHPANFLNHRWSKNCMNNLSHTGSHSPPSRPQISEPVACRGVDVEWKGYLETYPYHLHESPLVELDWIPIGFLHEEEKIIFRATNCTGTGEFIASTQSIVPCPTCWRIPYSADFKRFADRAIECKEGTALDYLNPVQHRTLLDKTRREMKSLWTKVCEITDPHFSSQQ
jgi:hypothetical protein